MSGEQRGWLRRTFEFVERLPFEFGQFLLVRFENEHKPITNRGESDMPQSVVPSDIQLEAIEREKARRRERRE